jgi:hypothetical protein
MRRSDRAASLLSRKAQRTLEVPEVNGFAARDLLLSAANCPRSRPATALALGAGTEWRLVPDCLAKGLRLAQRLALAHPFELGELR